MLFTYVQPPNGSCCSSAKFKGLNTAPEALLTQFPAFLITAPSSSALQVH